jgi:hypothetical protein
MVSKGVLHIAGMSPPQLETYERVLHAVNLSRRYDIPVNVAAHEAGTTLQAILKYARPALKRVGDRWMARASDRLERRMRFYDPNRSYKVTVSSSEVASRISAYHRDGMGRFVETGSRTKLQGFAGKYVVDVDGRRHYFLTDPTTIRRLARSGQLGGFSGIY